MPKFEDRTIFAACAALALALALAACGAENAARDGQATLAPETAAPAAGSGTAAAEPAVDGKPSAAQTEDARLDAFFEQVFQRDLERNPGLATQLGLKLNYGKCNDLSDAFAVEENELTKGDLKRLRTEFDTAKLSPAARLSYRLFEYNAEQALEAFRYRHSTYPLTQMFALTTFAPTFLINFHRVDTVSDAEAYVSRLKCLRDSMQQTVDNLRIRAEQGVIAPAFTFDYVLGDSRKVISGAPFDESGTDSPVWADFKKKVAALDSADTEKERLLNEARTALTTEFKQGYEAVLAYETELKAKAQGNKGVWSLPDGAAYYQSRVRAATTTDMGAEEIHELGLAEVARLRGEMEEIKALVGFEGSLADFFEHVKNRPENFYPDTDEGRQQLLRDAQGMIDQVNAKVGDYFNLLPEAGIEVKAVEKFRQDTSPIAFYNRPSQDGSRPGYYYMNMKDMKAVHKHTLEAITYHEAVPGHHFQLALQQELGALPRFRRFGGYTAFVEGWALYAELLAKEMGFYDNPYSDFGRLTTEMWRAVRLVVDTGIHHKKWTREKAIDYMSANVPISKADVVKEIERYFVIPGQALSYKVGMLKILDLRRSAREALGDDFDIRDFHDTVLGNGALPLLVLEERVADYVEEKKPE